jgi:hypothetical protein
MGRDVTPDRKSRRLRRRKADGLRLRLFALTALRERGLPLGLAAAGIGVHVSTAVRWHRRALRGEPLVNRRGPHTCMPSDAARDEAARLVRDLHALIGAEALRHSVPGLSRRQAAHIKTETAREMERERRAGLQHVVISVPGVLRGFDAMDLGGRARPAHALIAADGCVPYRTSWTVSEGYDGPAVFDLLERDFETHGPPLVLRMDRATQHAVPAVERLLLDNKVLRLHGPSYYAPYYGQLERQNREHRAWLADCMNPRDLDTMMAALNGEWRRKSLRWQTAAEAWAQRPRLEIDRDALAEEARDRAQRLRRTLDGNAVAKGLTWRLAVKQALSIRGLLRIETGGWC